MDTISYMEARMGRLVVDTRVDFKKYSYCVMFVLNKYSV